ncbi:MAG: neutral/alkaline non-lysosomal ceramidase N-terminal domain-containing protein, partial [Sphingobacterium hotanense]
MNRIIIQAITLSFMIFNIFLSRSYAQDLNGKTWKVGLATANITPEKPMWLAGYASRTKPSEGSIHPLWAKCILFEDAQGNRSLLLTLEVVGIGNSFSNDVRQAISKETGAPIENIIINCSHTHSGPVLDYVLTGIYPLDDSNKMVIVEYGKWLRETLIQLSIQALQDLEPVKLFAKNGVSRVQVNRRTNQEKDIASLKELKGPNDFSVPVFKIETASGKLKAIIFGYACHPTVLTGYQWSGDYAGFAQSELE